MHADCHVSSDQIGSQASPQRVNAGRKWVRSRHSSYVAAGMREMMVRAQSRVMREETGMSLRDDVSPLYLSTCLESR